MEDRLAVLQARKARSRKEGRSALGDASTSALVETPGLVATFQGPAGVVNDHAAEQGGGLAGGRQNEGAAETIIHRQHPHLPPADRCSTSRRRARARAS